MYDDAYTRNENDELAVRTVSTNGDTSTNINDVFTRDNDGKLCLRVTGAGGGGSDPHNKGYFATQAALEEAYPTGSAGDYAIVGSTDTIWLWDEDTSAWIDSDQKGQVESVNGQTGAVNIKSINNNSLMGSGNIELSTYLPYPSGWTTTGTTKALCDDIAADTSATVGKAYLGEVTCSDLPASMANAEIVVEIMSGTTSSNKVIVLTCSSGNAAPYRWQYTYWNGGSNVSGWVTWATSEQGALAESAVQPGDLATVATTGDYNDLINKPTASGVPQYTTMPTASASNVGELGQYNGVTIPDVPSAATITQTTGSGLSDLEINVSRFEGVEQPAGAETVAFTARTEVESLSPTRFELANGVLTIDQAVFLAQWRNLYGEPSNIYQFEIVVGDNTQDTSWSVGFYYDNTVSYTTVNHTDFGLDYSGTDDPQTSCLIQYTRAGTYWSKSGTDVNLSDYGISFSGTPTDGDVLTVNYTPAVPGVTNGYFYKSSVKYNEPSATISQTTGSSLTDLSVNIDTFIEAEQPTQDEQVDFVANVVEETAVLGEPQGSGAGDWTATLNWSQLKSSVENTFSFSDWDSVTESFFECLDADNDSWSVIIRTEFGQYSNSGSSSYWGLTVTGTPQNNDIISIQYISGSSTWEKDDSPVDPATYGISFSGTPNDGDVLTVNYIAPTPIGYYWNRTDVQPSSGDNTDIKWTRHLDKPENESWNYEDYLTAVFDKLPAGHYQWKFSVCAYINGYIPIKNYYTFLIDFWIKYDESDNPQGTGTINWVLDGSTSFYSSTFELNGNYDAAFGLDPDNDTQKMDIRGNMLKVVTQNVSSAIENCCLWTDIINVDTNEKIPVDIVRGELSDSNFGSAGMGHIVTIDVTPDSSSWSWGSPDAFKAFGITLPALTGEILVTASYGSDKLFAMLENVGDEKKPIMLVNLKIATGIFKDSYFVEAATGSTLGLVHNFPQGSSDQLFIKVVKSGKETNEQVYTWLIDNNTYPSFDFSACATREVGGPISYINYGMIEQYTGTTDANYTNGYFYKATGTIVDVPQSVTPYNYSVQNVTISVDATDLVAAIQNVTGWQESDIITYLSGYEWAVTYDADNDTVINVWFGAYGDFDSSTGVPQLFTVTASGLSGEQYIGFMMAYTEAHKEVQNGTWTRVDVQPGGAIPTDKIDLYGYGSYWKTYVNLIDTGANIRNNMKIGTIAGSSEWAIGVEGGQWLSFKDWAVYLSSPVSSAQYRATLGIATSPITAIYASALNSGRNNATEAQNRQKDITIPDVGGKLAVQVSSIPTADSTNEGAIYQYIGATDSVYTNGHFYKCISDGATPTPNYSWIEVQIDSSLISADRLASTTGLADGNYRLRLVIANGVPTLEWVAE